MGAYHRAGAANRFEERSLISGFLWWSVLSNLCPYSIMVRA